MKTWFFERSDGTARRSLEGFGSRLAAAGLETRLLRSCDDAKRYLLVVHGAELPSLETPSGTRTWTFEPA